MLAWRAISACARLACSEALYGVAYTSDEMWDVNVVGEVVEQRGLGAALAAENSDPDPGVSPPAEPDAAPSPADQGESSGSEPDVEMTKRTRGQLFALFAQKGVEETDQLPGINHITGKTYTSRADITEADGLAVIEVLLKRPDVEKGSDQ
jgi:hypothetical protein